MVMKIFFHKNGTKQQITKFPHPFFFFSLFFSLKNFQEPRTLVRKMRSISYNHFLKFEIRKQLLIPRTCLTKNPSNSTLPRVYRRITKRRKGNKGNYYTVSTYKAPLWNNAHIWNPNSNGNCAKHTDAV